jgi:subtilisin family serine protease
MHKNRISQKLFSIMFATLFISLMMPSATHANEQNKKNENPFKKNWTAAELIKLGYEPDEILITFKDDEINLKTTVGINQAKQFIDSKKGIGNEIIDDFIKKGKIAAASISDDSIRAIKSDFIEVKQYMPFINTIVVRIKIDNAVKETIDALSNDPKIRYISPNYVGQATMTPSEPAYSNGQLWGLKNIGTTLVQGDLSINEPPYATNNPDPNHNDPDIQIEDAWNMFTGNGSVVVAVLDSGIDYNHSNLDGNMWSPSGACYDQNDNVISQGCPNHGWDYVNMDNDPMDDFGHGTHVAGIIGASEGDGGVVGVNWNVKLMAVKCIDENGIVNLGNLLIAIKFAQNNGANIINASLEFDNIDYPIVEERIENFVDNGGLFVASAGNYYRNLEDNPVYPAAYDLDGAQHDNLISVAATDQADEIWDNVAVSGQGSDWGTISVDIAAPGANILSTYNENGTSTYKFMSGTSMSAPFVTGVAAMIMGAYPNLTATQVKEIIMNSGDPIADLNPDTGGHPIASGRRLNAYNALVMAKQIVEAPTIHSTTTGGTWNDPATWVENRVPNGSDIVEINGTVSLDVNATISGLKVNGQKFLYPYGANTLTVNGDLDNEGTIADYYVSLTLDISGDVTNGSSGIITNYQTLVYGNVANNGTIENLSLKGGVAHTLSGTAATPIHVTNDATVTGEPKIGNVTVDVGKTLTIAEDVTAHISGDIINNGTINGDEILLNGNQTLYGMGTYNVNKLTFGVGNTYKNVGAHVTVNGNVEVLSGVSLYPSGANTLTINGNLDNEGTIADYYVSLTLNISGDVTNGSSGIITNYQTLVYGNVANNGTIYNLSFKGEASHALSGTSATPMHVTDDATITGEPKIGDITVDAGKTLTIAEGITANISGNITNNGTINGDEILLNGNQTLTGMGPYNVNKLTFGVGNTYKSVGDHVTVNGNVEVLSGVNLVPYETNTLTINGDLDNEGTIRDYYASLTFDISGNVTNGSNGVMSNYQNFVYGNVANNGTIYNLSFKGEASHALSGTSATPMHVTDDATITGEPKIGDITVDAGKTLTIAEGITANISGNITNNGTINGDEILLNGNQTLTGMGTYNVNKLTFGGGNTYKSVGDHVTVNGNVEVLSGVNLVPYETDTLTINGDLDNEGTIRDYYASLTLDISGDVTNNGTMVNYQTNAKWEPIQDAISYDFQIKTTGVWQDPISTGTNTYYSIQDYLTTSHEWRSRGTVNGTPTAWSAAHLIN